MSFRQLAKFLLRKAKLLFAFLVVVSTWAFQVKLSEIVTPSYVPSNKQILAMNGVCGLDGTTRLCDPDGLPFCWFKQCPPVIFWASLGLFHSVVQKAVVDKQAGSWGICQWQVVDIGEEQQGSQRCPLRNAWGDWCWCGGMSFDQNLLRYVGDAALYPQEYVTSDSVMV